MTISWLAFGVVLVLWVVGDFRRGKEVDELRAELKQARWDLDAAKEARDLYRNETVRARKGLQHLDDFAMRTWEDAEPGEFAQAAFDLRSRVIDVKTYVHDDHADPDHLPWRH
ncbi:hypothetical protein VPZ60_004316 [Salmonella enterica]|nr:hypothetical protein [Salmonella enterica]